MGGKAAATSRPPGGIDGFLIREGPTILVVSMVAVALAFAIQRRAALIPAVLAGGLLYWGIYEQDDLTLMYVTSGVGLLMWVATYFWLRRRRFDALNAGSARG